MNTNYINSELYDLSKTAVACSDEYENADPFPSISFKNFFNPEILDQVLAEFPDLSTEASVHFDKSKEKKFAGIGESSFGKETKDFMHFLNSEPFVKFLHTLTGIAEPLIVDPMFEGGGLHEIKRGGLLKLHADFNKHGSTLLDRRVNVLIYLNKDWKEEYGGHLELWTEDLKYCRNKILPEFNTLAIFSTTSTSYHGHPDPLKCPPDRSRKSLALYYYSNGRPENENSTTHSTVFVARPENEEDKQAFAQNSIIKKVAKKLLRYLAD